MRYIILLFALLTSIISSAQDTLYVPEYMIKVYGFVSASEVIPRNGIIHHSQHQFLSPSFAFYIKNKRGNAHEIELTSLQINQSKIIDAAYLNGQAITANSTRLTTTSLALRYEYIVNLAKKKSWLLKPALGFAGSPYYTRQAFTPYASNYSPYTETYIGVRGFVIPRLTYRISNRINADINFPICIFDNNYAHNRLNNPSLPRDFRTHSTVNANVLPDYITARAGIGISL